MGVTGVREWERGGGWKISKNGVEDEAVGEKGDLGRRRGGRRGEKLPPGGIKGINSNLSPFNLSITSPFEQ
jgi:hypothetical protein